MISNTMVVENERKGGKSVVVVLNGIRVLTEKKGIAPLKCALRDVVVAKDKVLVINIFNWKACTPSPASTTYCCLLENRNNDKDDGRQRDSYVKFLHEEINRREEACTNIFGPFYKYCKSIGVKFVVQTATDFELPSSSIIEKEAKNEGATWIIMDSDDEEHCCTLPNLEGNDQPFDPSLVASTSRQEEILPADESLEEIETTPDDNNSSARVFSMVDQALGMPTHLTWEVISEITGGFREIIGVGENDNFNMYGGYLCDKQSRIVVKRFIGDFSAILEAEKKAALAMYHKNILRLIAYHKNENATVLVFPYTKLGTLDKYLHGERRENPQLAFEDSMKIAIGIAQGLQYMHEECPRGPVVHGNLRPCHIFLRDDLQPQITGFGKATWLQLEQSTPISSHRDHSDPASLTLLRKDIHDFGILLLRLFCRNSASLGNTELVQWAGPLLQQRVYPQLFDGEILEHLDPYEIFRVTCAAAQCIKTRQISRSYMSTVVSWLKGEISCVVESSPSSEGSPNVDLNMYMPQSVDLSRRY
ncbi:hypothetical protein LguiA_020249 [Lonicera macranthoides]